MCLDLTGTQLETAENWEGGGVGEDCTAVGMQPDEANAPDIIRLIP